MSVWYDVVGSVPPAVPISRNENASRLAGGVSILCSLSQPDGLSELEAKATTYFDIVTDLVRNRENLGIANVVVAGPQGQRRPV